MAGVKPDLASPLDFSNYFLSYLDLQAFFLGALTFSQALAFARSAVGWMFDKTPRQKWRRTHEMNVLQWGTFFPVYTNLACIAILTTFSGKFSKFVDESSS